MTDRERAIVMAYTGTVMLCGDKLDVFYDYVSEKLGRPIYTHEFIDQAERIKDLSRDDFLSLCAGEPYPKPKLRTPPEIDITDEDGNVKWVLRLRKKGEMSYGKAGEAQEDSESNAYAGI